MKPRDPELPPPAPGGNQIRLVASILTVVVLAGAAYGRNAVWSDGIRLWEDAVKKSPTKARPHYNLGSKYEEAGRLREAVGEYRVALALKPDYLEPHNNLGNMYFKAGLPDDALREYKIAETIKPDAPTVHNNLGYVYFAQGRYEDAFREYQTALALKPDFDAARNNLETLYRNWDKSGAPPGSHPPVRSGIRPDQPSRRR